MHLMQFYFFSFGIREEGKSSISLVIEYHLINTSFQPKSSAISLA